MPIRPAFDPSRPLVVARAFRFLGRDYAIGDPFPHANDDKAVNTRQRSRQYEARAVNFAPTEVQDPVQMNPAGRNGSWILTAPWLDEPEIVRGKKNAETRLEELREEGPPLGWIEGGTEVEITDLDGGWYEITAPWLEDDVKVQGRDEAEARQREIHAEGEPDHHHGVSLTEAETGNGYYDVKADWWAEAERVHGIEEARRVAGDLRTEGPPEGWDPSEGVAVDGDAANGSDQDGDAPADPSAADAPTEAETASEGGDTPEDAENGTTDADSDAETRNTPADTLTTTDEQTTTPPSAELEAAVEAKHVGGGMYEVTAPWLDAASRVRGGDAAEAERVRIVNAGPPEGWTPAGS